MKTRLEKRDRELARERSEHHAVAEELGMAQFIVDPSPVILFRRKAGGNLQLEYISENLRNFGYSPEEFFNHEIQFKDIIYEGDIDRVTDEVIRFAKADLEEYSQQYRLVTKSGVIRWVEDQTSVVRDEAGTKIKIRVFLLTLPFENWQRKNYEKVKRNSVA